jgi:hypothetical protein
LIAVPPVARWLNGAFNSQRQRIGMVQHDNLRIGDARCQAFDRSRRVIGTG